MLIKNGNSFYKMIVCGNYLVLLLNSSIKNVHSKGQLFGENEAN